MFPFFVITIITLILVGVYLLFRQTTVLVPEDNNAVVVDKHNFVKCILPAGVHHLKPGLEKIEFTFETKPKLTQGMALDIPTNEGVLVKLDWSGIYARDASLINERMSQKLRGLPTAEKAIQRHVDLALRRLVGTYTVQDLFKPQIRERIERQLTELLRDKVKASGIALMSLNLQAIHLPPEVEAALNQAKAIQTLDIALRTSDVATREMVVAAHHLDDLLEWEKLLPPYGKYMLAKQAN